MNATKRQKGNIGEQIACNYLQKKGWKILERNFHYSKYAEIDIIAKEKDCIVFVEVKTRTTTNYGHPFESINKTKLANIYKAALAYLKNTKEKYKSYRIDAISILGETTDTQKNNIEHLKDISLN